MRRKLQFCDPPVALTFEGVCETLQVGSGRGAGFKRQGYIFVLAVRWMTGGDLVA